MDERQMTNGVAGVGEDAAALVAGEDDVGPDGAIPRYNHFSPLLYPYGLLWMNY